jgi:hypothetical protein
MLSTATVDSDAKITKIAITSNSSSNVKPWRRRFLKRRFESMGFLCENLVSVTFISQSPNICLRVYRQPVLVFRILLTSTLGLELAQAAIPLRFPFS